MRSVCLLWLIAGCGFTSSPGPAEDPGSPGGPNGPGDPGMPVGPGGGSGSTSPCDASDPAPILCLAFGGASLVSDLAVPAHDIVDHTGIRALTNIVPITGFVVQTAGAFDMSSKLRVRESPDLDVDDLTIDLWMSPDGGLGTSDPSWLVVNNGEYSAAYTRDGTVHCAVPGTSLDSGAKATAGTWHHVACTYAMARRELRVYVDGDLSGCKTASAIPNTGKDGVAIGALYDPTPKPGQPNFQQHFAGSLGRLHVYGTELTADQICGAAGRTGCSQSCSGSDGDGG